MTYKLNPSVSKITCPVITVIGGKETQYKNGQCLANASFEKNYTIKSISAKNSAIIIHLDEYCVANNINWIGEEEIIIKTMRSSNVEKWNFNNKEF